ncbi:RidA family protein [Acinetobacter silvestris]|uniref:YjgF family translation initiation inhibitor n=1 Tax=Acinetobacter silvestris TaxID=1977882 RepID=A0A1Y3CDL1_9GAMM|nr:RidA family protein [Acinetobacter silvestris]OTG64740.1 YjgF family translation initiation inhibitor [Acinetobacter silvestris]
MNSKIGFPMCSFQVFNPKTLYNPRPFAYSHVAEVRHFLRVLHISGQGGENQRGQLSLDFAEQTHQAFLNLKNALESVDASLLDIAVLRILVVDHSSKKHQFLIQEMQQLWKDQDFPACTLIPVPCLAIQGMLIEIEATAYCM